MDARTTIVVLVVVAMAASVSLPAVAATPTPTDDSGDDAAAEAAMTAFMQSTAARANDSIESGMWQARVHNANESTRASMVTNRTDRLSERLERLQERNRSLKDRYENGTLPEAAYHARASQLSGRIVALRDSVSDTGVVAAEVGVDRTQLARLRQNASELRGPQVAVLARGLTGNDSSAPVTDPQEPPDWVPTNETDGGQPDDPGNGGPPVDDPAGEPPDGGGNAGPRQGGGSNGADPPAGGENAGPPDGGGPDTGPPQDAGPADDTGPPAGAGAATDAGPPAGANQVGAA